MATKWYDNIKKQNLEYTQMLNEKLGFIKGDFFLKETIEYIKNLKEDIIISRFGSNEFITFFVGVVSEEDIIYSEGNLTNKSYNRNVDFERLLKWLRDAEQHNDLSKSTFQEVMSKEQSGLGHLLNL
ncbi:MAG: CBS domain-containing protein [Lachnospira sp.]|nr:CBS domain-containing protein [Lachnospira sp.]